MVRRFLVVVLLTVLPCVAQFSTETERLMATARLWVTVEYFHPYLAYRDIDWDQALVTAIPKIRAASNDAEYRTAISGMLDELHDPETYVVPNAPVVIIQAMQPPVESNQPLTASPQLKIIRTAVDAFFLAKPRQAFLTPLRVPPNATFELEENLGVPAVIAALAQSGRVSIHSTAKHYQVESTESIWLRLGEMGVTVRLSEPTKPIPINSPTIGTSPVYTIPLAPITRPPSTRYADPYPPTEARLLAAIKTWGTIHYFFAYKDLVDDDWDEAFAAALPKFIEARDAIDYNLALADLLTHLTDTNTAAHSKTLDTYFGETPVGLRIRLLDKYPIITDVLDPAATAAGVHPGDVLKRIANESVTDRFRRFVQYIPASTAQRSGYDTVQRLTNGPAGSEVELAVENAQGEAHPVKLVRKPTTAPQRGTEPIRIMPGNIGYLDLDRLKPADADAALLKLKDTQALIFDLRGQAPAATAIASHLTADTNAAIALVTTPIALHPDIPTDGIATQSATTFVVRTLPRVVPPLYKGKTVALIDERTIGESEYAGLLFEAANKTEFVGAPSAGAESTLAELPLPGGITLTYSTEDIRHANGGKLQRLGLQPNIPAATTAKGLRAGIDEPLNAALAHLSQNSDR